MEPAVSLMLRRDTVPGHLHPLVWSLLGPQFRDSPWVKPGLELLHPGKQGSLEKNLSYIFLCLLELPPPALQCPWHMTAPHINSPLHRCPSQLHSSAPMRAPRSLHIRRRSGFRVLLQGDSSLRIKPSRTSSSRVKRQK